MTLPHRKLQTPPGRRGYKISDADQSLPLVYLGWGPRRFGKEPVSVARNYGYVYAIVLEGNPDVITAQERIRTHAGTLVVFDVDCPMGWTDDLAAKSSILVWIWRDRPTIETLRLQPQQCKTWKIDEGKLSGLERIHKDCRHELACLDDYSGHALANLQAELDVGILRSRSDASTKPGSETRYSVALNWMRHNFNAQHPVAELAIYLSVSESTLQRIFKRHDEKSPLSVFQTLKAERADHLIGEGNSIKSIAYQLGYRHPNDFTRFYTKAFGHSPSQRNRTSQD